MLYPQTPVPDIPVEVRKEHNNLITQLTSGIEYRRNLRFRERRIITLNYRLVPRSQMQEIYNFFSARKGAFEPFIFEFPYEDTWENEYVGKGDGATTVFTLPFKYHSSLSVYVDGTLTTGYTVDNTGERATITFSTAPAADSLITCSFTGKARLKVRFNDTIDYQNQRANLVSAKVSLIEVLD